jgi:hypothetical protein
MSYRSFKRALGETNLERKCRLLFGTCLLVLISGSFWWYSTATDQIVYEYLNRFVGKALVDYAMLDAHKGILGNTMSENAPPPDEYELTSTNSGPTKHSPISSAVTRSPGRLGIRTIRRMPSNLTNSSNSNGGTSGPTLPTRCEPREPSMTMGS